MAQVAINWVATQPGIASAIVGQQADQLASTMAALDFELPAECARNSIRRARCHLSRCTGCSPWLPEHDHQSRQQGGDKPAGYFPLAELDRRGMTSLSDEQSRDPEETAGQYSVDDEDQLSQEDTLIDRVSTTSSTRAIRRRTSGGTRDHETLDELLSEEEPDPPCSSATTMNRFRVRRGLRGG